MKKSLFLCLSGLAVLTSFARAGFSVNPLPVNAGNEKENLPGNNHAATIQDRGLWLLTVRISESTTSQLDTLISFEAGSHKWDKERHDNTRTVSRGEISAVIENQAEDPENEFWFDSDAGDPVKMSVSGDGMHTETSTYLETIDGKMILSDNRDINVSGTAAPGASVMFYYSADSKNVSVSMGIKATGSDKGRRFYDEWKDYGGDIDNYFIHCGGGCDISGDKGCNITKTSTGYTATWKLNENKQLHSVNGTEFIISETTLNLTITPYKESDKPEVTLEGCSEMGAGEEGAVTATGKPEGGTYEFWVDPSDLMSVDASGSSATLKGSRPGRGTLYVEYTSPEGKKAQASKPAAMVRIYDYNGGEAIQIPLYNIDGKKTSGKLTIPYSSEPDEAQELVDFISGNPAVFTASATADDITLQGLKTGKATLEARDNCGNTTGPTVDVEVVNCDRETVEALERMKKAAIENMQDAANELQKLAASEEFSKAMKDIPGAAQKLVAKAALTIITSGTAPTKAIKTAGELAEAGAAISELIGSGTASELGGNAFKNAVGQLGGELVNTLVGVVEVGEAGLEFGEKLGQILRHESTMKGAMENFDQAAKNLREVERLQNICKSDKAEPQKQEPPKADQPPKPDEPTPTPTEPPPATRPKPKEDNPPAQEPTGDKPAPDEPGQAEPPDNPPPTTQPRQVALPYQASDCGCRKQKSIGTSTNDIAKIEAGTKNLGDCADRFTKTTVSDYSSALTELSELTKSLQSGAGDKPEMFLKQAKEAKPQLDSLIMRVRAYDEAGKTFLGEFEKCPESLKTGMDVLKSALTVTIDSIKTKY